jgi:hypothetical protein
MNLQAAIEAVRAETAEAPDGASATRRRVLASIERSPRRRLHGVVAAVIASMFGASAYAFHARAPRLTPAEVVPPAPIASTIAATEPVVVANRTWTRTTPALPAVAPDVPAEEPAEVGVATPVVASPSAAPAVAVVAPPAPVTVPAMPEVESAAPIAAADAQRDPILALYATAHQLHFRARDMAAALDAWNRYLAAAPDGSLAPEARFNRVVALVRLERWREASHALDALGDSTFRADDLARLRSVVASHLTPPR